MGAEGGTAYDYASVALLAEMHKRGIIELAADIVLNGDSVLPSSMEVAEKFHVLSNISDVPVLLSQTTMYNAFPWTYRDDSQRILDYPEYTSIPCDACTYQNVTNAMDYPDAEAWLSDFLAGAE